MAEDPKSISISENRKARFEYEVLDKLEVGIVLTGSEVKSLRLHSCNLNDAYALDYKDELYLYNCHIPEYKGANRFNHEPMRTRKLLLKRKQLNKLMGQLKTKGITLVPLAMYFNARSKVKIMLGVARGKKEYEKRDSIKERDWQREKERIFKGKW